MATEDVNISIGADSSKAIGELNKVQQKFKELAAAANTPIGIAINSKAAKKEFEDLSKAFEQYRTQLYKDKRSPNKRSPSKGGLTEDAFFGVYGFKKGEADKAVSEFARILKNSATNQINQASEVEKQVTAITRKSNAEQNYLAKLRINSDKQNANAFSKVWDEAHAEYIQREDRMVKSAQAANKHRTEAADRAAKVESKAFSNAIKNRMQDEVAAENYLAKLRANSARLNQAQIDKDHAAALKEFAAIKKAAEGADISMPSLRYALYDIANSSQRVASALTSFGATIIGFAAEYETAFTGVERTTLSGRELLDSIESQLISLSQAVPVAFADLAEIASLGAQLGVATGDLSGFAKTVAEFSAVTNVSTESAAQSFGALGELLNVSASEYDNLGSSIAKVGVDSVATESEILSVATAIGGVANSSGLSADYVVGLSGALASLRVPAEQSRGALTRVFQEINRSASGTGVAMESFASIMGVSAEEAQRLATSDMEGFFTQFVRGLSGLDATQLTATLDALNLSDIRVTNTLTRLSRNTELVAETMKNANVAYDDGTFLSQVYALKVDDLASKMQILKNSAQNLAAGVGSALEPALKPVVDFIISIVQGFNALVNTQSGAVFVRIAAGAGVLVTAITGLITTLATAVASLGAVRFSLNTLGWDTATSGIRKYIAVMFGAAAATDATSAAAGRLKLALIRTGIGAIVVLLGTLAAAMVEAATSSQNMFNKFFTDSSGMADALAKDTEARNQALAAGNIELANSFTAVTYAGTTLNENYSEMAKRVSTAAQAVGTDMTNALDYASESIDQNTRYIGENTEAWARNKLMSNEAFQELASQRGAVDLLQGIGFDMKGFLAASAQGKQAVEDYFIGLAKSALESGKITEAQLQSWDTLLAAKVTGINTGIGKAPSNGVQIWALEFTNNVRKVLPFLGGLMDIVYDVVSGIFNVGFQTDSVTNTLEGLGTATTDQIAIQELMSSAVGDSATSLDGLGSSASGAAEKIYLLTDYASDLASIWERAGDIRFSGQETFDSLATKLTQIAKDAEDAANSVRDLSDEINSLNADIDVLVADKSLKEYFLSVAEAYGDTLKAASLRADIAKINSEIAQKTGELADKNNDLREAQDKTNKTLVGNSTAAIENRSNILELVSAYQSHLKALAESGMSQEDLRKTASQLKSDFIEQAKQLGYNETELELYATAFDDVRAAIDAVPRNLTVDFNGDPALTAINEFVASANNALGGVGGSGGITAPTPTPKTTTPSTTSDSDKQKELSFWDQLKQKAGEVWANITTFASDAFKKINDFFKPVTDAIGWLGGLFEAMWMDVQLNWDRFVAQPIGKAMEDLGIWWDDYVGTPINDAISEISEWWDTNVSIPVGKAMEDIGEWWDTYISTPINNSINSIAGWWDEHVSKPINNAIAGIQSAWDGVTSAIRDGMDWVGSKLRDAFSGLAEFIRFIAPNTAEYFGFSTGGYVSGPGTGTSDSINARLSNGEYVIRAAAVQQYGVGFFDQLNQMRTPQYFSGSTVIASQGNSIVSLSPEDRALLRNIGGSGEVVLYANNEAIARSANAGNKAIVAAGGRP